ncbi:MAG: apolipoprotein N-acyltransferase [Terracidiphilus sp.]
MWAAAVLSAGLLELPFPLAGPMPPWRSAFAWFGLVPLMWAVLSATSWETKRPVRRGFLLGYVCGVLWYMGNCYWVRDVMMKYGDMPALAPFLLLTAFSLVLGLYFGLFAVCMALLRRASGSTRMALMAAPVLWAAMELAAARITSVPWDQLGYSQVDNGLVNQLAPWTGVYGISFVLVAVNALLAARLLPGSARGRRRAGLAGVALLLMGWTGIFWPVPTPHPTATAVLIQPNLDVGAVNAWSGSAWDAHMAEFARLAETNCSPDIEGIPQTGAPKGMTTCEYFSTAPDLVVWPESPAPFAQADPRFVPSMAGVVKSLRAPLVVGGVGMDYSESGQQWHDYNSAMVFGADGAMVGRYDKIHLVPFGEYVPFRKFLFFARKLTGQVSSFDRGQERKVFRLNGHRYGVFICYEAVFADEVREFSRLGAEVLVNVSDDGWYGDTSAPWQHLNMARMRAIENRRWLLRDTNNGVTAAVDPYGRVQQSIARHQAGALPAAYGFREDVTFYSEHGDVFAWVCAILALGIVGRALRASLRSQLSNKVRS